MHPQAKCAQCVPRPAEHSGFYLEWFLGLLAVLLARLDCLVRHQAQCQERLEGLLGPLEILEVLLVPSLQRQLLLRWRLLLRCLHACPYVAHAVGLAGLAQ